MPNKTLSNKQVLDIMKRHQGFRNAIKEHRPDLPLMSDEEFIKKFREICPKPLGVVTGRQVGKIYQLRRDYEMLPPGRHGYAPKFSRDTVRIQARDNLIAKLSPDELEMMFNVRKMQENWYWLEDVLKINLGRWPAEKRELTRADVLRWWRPEEQSREKKEAEASS